MSSRSTLSYRPIVLRGGLAALAVLYTVVGTWVLLSPSSFYREFPGLGVPWVSALPPYNEHLLTDVGGAWLAIAVALWFATLVPQRRLLQGVLVATLVQATPHFVYHLAHVEALPAPTAAVNQLTLAAPIVVALGLLWLASRISAAPTLARVSAKPS